MFSVPFPCSSIVSILHLSSSVSPVSPYLPFPPFSVLLLCHLTLVGSIFPNAFLFIFLTSQPQPVGSSFSRSLIKNVGDILLICAQSLVLPSRLVKLPCLHAVISFVTLCFFSPNISGSQNVFRVISDYFHYRNKVFSIILTIISLKDLKTTN